MPTVFDVAEYILLKRGPMTAMKLQKLVYYAQAWSLVWDDAPLFPEPIEAWANGPVCPALYQAHRKLFEVRAPIRPTADAAALTPAQQETVDAVLFAYGGRTSQWLSDLTHSEDPWRDARGGLRDGERGARPISHVAMAEYYSALTPSTATSLG